MKRECCNKDEKCMQGPRGYQGIRGPMGPQGPRGPQGEVGPEGPPNIAYAQYLILSITTKGNPIPISTVGIQNVGELTNLTGIVGGEGTTIELTEGYIYYVSFIMTANLKTGGSFEDGYFQVTPQINGSWLFIDTQVGIGTDTSNGNASISGGFIVYQSASALAKLEFILSTGVTGDIDINGAISIFPIAKATA